MDFIGGNDFYLVFKPVYKDGIIEDYILSYVSETFYTASKMSPGLILGKTFSEIAVDNSDKLGFKELYIDLNPKVKRKYETFLKDLNRWYLVNTFAESLNNEEALIIYYVDIDELKQNRRNNFLYSAELKGKVININDRRKMLYRDTLTGLYNKNYFDEELSRLDTKRQLPISIIMGDINGLKLINDAFGHQMGDNALKKAAEIMLSCFRQEDIICRISGDEFIILLPKTPEETALKIIDRIKNKCEINPLDFLRVSISFGVATKNSVDIDINKILRKAENKMYFNKLKESKEAKITMIKSLKSRLEKITNETKSHNERLKKLCMLMATALDLSHQDKEDLKLLCDFHDIGKIGISKNILQKPGSLNSEEWENVRRHSEIGYYIAKEYKEVSHIDELILIHHERWDGKGYPGLLKNEEIPISARIFAIADAYDVMVNDSPYKSRMTNRQALQEIKDKSGSQFDPNIAEIFIKIMDGME